MFDGKRFGAPAIRLVIALAGVSVSVVDTGSFAAAPASQISPTGPLQDQAEIKIAAGYLDRGGSAVCYGGTHQLIDSCSGAAVPLQSAALELDAFLCRYLEATGIASGSGGGVVETLDLRETLNLCPVDCDVDGLHDECAIRHRLIPDCNGNDVPDRCDIQGKTSTDCNQDGVPDECQEAACESSNDAGSKPVTDPERSLVVSVRTDKAVYAPGEPVQIEIQLANLNPDREVNLRFATPCKVTFRIEELSGENVYLDLYHHSCTYHDEQLTLSAGPVESYAFVWDQRDDRGRPISQIANFVVRGMVLYQHPTPDDITGILIRP